MNPEKTKTGRISPKSHEYIMEEARNDGLTFTEKLDEIVDIMARGRHARDIIIDRGMLTHSVTDNHSAKLDHPLPRERRALFPTLCAFVLGIVLTVLVF